MPIAPTALFAQVGLKIEGSARWGERVPCTSPGVYAISLCGDPRDNGCLRATSGISVDLVRAWIDSVPTFLFNGTARPDASDVAAFLERFWMPDECIVYIGKATCLRQRLGSFVRHRLGERRPHAGGHWLKTLADCDNLFVHFCVGDSADAAEKEESEVIEAFRKGVSAATKARLFNPQMPIPFANREHPKGTRKQNLIAGDVRR